MVVTIITLIATSLIISCHYVEKTMIQTKSYELYQAGERLKSSIHDKKTLNHQPYHVTVTSKTDKKAKYDVQHQQEFAALEKDKQYGYDIRDNTLYVALQTKTHYIVLSQSIQRLLSPIHHFYSFLIIGLVAIVLGIIGLLWLLFHRHKKQLAQTIQFVEKIQKHPTEEHQFIAPGHNWEALYESLSSLSHTLSENMITVSESQMQFNQLINDLPIGIFLMNEQKEMIFINRHAQQLLDVTPPLPQSYLEIFHNHEWIQEIEKVLTTKRDAHYEWHTLPPQEQWIDVSLRYITNTHHVLLLGTLYDVTNLRKIELMQQDFVGNVSHELKTPITSIMGFIETLLDGAIEDEETARYFLEIMDKDAHRLNQLIKEIVQLSHYGKELDDHKKTPVKPMQCIQSLLPSYQKQMQEKHLHLELTGDMDASFKTHFMYFEPIVKNLFENAILYNKPNGTITVNCTQTEHDITLSISDTGIGMTTQDLERVFERFYRVDKARSRNMGGTGLGLSIVEHYTDILSGTLHVESQLGVGSTFTLTFPK